MSKDKVPVISSTDERGEKCDLWMESPEAKYSVQAPMRLVEVLYSKKHGCILDSSIIPKYVQLFLQDIHVLLAFLLYSVITLLI